MEKIREHFPFLKENPDVVYFDNAATSLKPQSVLDEIIHYYTYLSSNIHRGDYKSSIETSQLYDQARIKIKDFIHAQSSKEIVLTSGASESLNMIAMSLCRLCEKGDVILLNKSEHSSNLIPWFVAAKENGLKIEWIESEGLDIDVLDLENSMHGRVKIVPIAHVSNVLGYRRDIKSMAEIIHRYNAYIVVDGAQAVGHFGVDVQDLNTDFYAFSAHKMYGPSGLGVLYAKESILEQLQPIYYGGGSNSFIDNEVNYKLKNIPTRFESGTPNIEGTLAFAKAIDFLIDIGMDEIEKYNEHLSAYAFEKLSKLKNIKIYNPRPDVGIISFNIKGIFAQDVAQYLDHFNIYVRAGEHCAKLLDPLLDDQMTVRLSLAFYNTKEEIDKVYNVLSSITLEKCISLYV